MGSFLWQPLAGYRCSIIQWYRLLQYRALNSTFMSHTYLSEHGGGYNLIAVLCADQVSHAEENCRPMHNDNQEPFVRVY